MISRRRVFFDVDRGFFGFHKEFTVSSDAKGEIKEIVGNTCAKGEAYVREEFSRPKRVLTSTVAIEGAEFSRLPVRTSNLIPKDKIFDCMNEIMKAKVEALVKLGDKVISNLLNLGVDVIATRDLA